MGLFKLIITHTVVKNTDDAIEEKSTEKLTKEDKTCGRKVPLFKTPVERAEYTSLYFIASQAIYTMILIACQEKLLSWEVFFRSYAISSFVSFALLLLGLLIYGLYRAKLLPLLFIIIPLPLFAIMPIGFTYGFHIFKDFFLGVWMNTTTKLIFILLGIIAVVSSIITTCSYESNGTKKKTKNQEVPQISDEESENTRALLRSAIQDNAIDIIFLKRKWNFTTNSNVLFGYDEQNKQFIFVSDENSYVLSGKKVIYFDFEDISSNSRADININKYQRLIKLYYLSSGKKESVLYLAQIYATGENINKIKHCINNCPASSDEVIFRRKIRHLASTLEKETYPRRPFLNDEWFDLLKEIMEKIRNNKTDGYSLFKQKVINAEDYMIDESLSTIICDLSVYPPNKTSAKKEARRLCLHDFTSTLGNNIKSSIKDIFSDS